MSDFPCTLHNIFLFGYKSVCMCKIFSKPLFFTCFAFRNVCLHSFRHIKTTDQTIWAFSKICNIYKSWILKILQTNFIGIGTFFFFWYLVCKLHFIHSLFLSFFFFKLVHKSGTYRQLKLVITLIIRSLWYNTIFWVVLSHPLREKVLAFK